MRSRSCTTLVALFTVLCFPLLLHSENNDDEHHHPVTVSHRDNIQGFFKGAYKVRSTKPDSKKAALDHGTSVIWMNEIKTIESASILRHNEKNNMSSPSSSVLLASASIPRHKLMILDTDLKQDYYSFWYGIYDKTEGLVLASNHNFSYHLLHHNYSFILSENEKEENHTESNSRFTTCKTMMILKFDEAKKSISGNFSNCKYNLSMTSLLFMDKSQFEYKANEYGILSLCAVSASFYFLFKQLEHSNSMGNMIKISFLTLYVQFIYNGIICFLHFQIATQIESLFTTFLVVCFIALMNANLYSKMMTEIWRIQHPEMTANSIKLFHFIKILSFIAILFLSQCIINGTYSLLIFFVLSSDWLFQIAHSVRTGHFASWKHKVMILNTASKLFYPLYVYGCPYNLLQTETNFTFSLSLIVWCALQIGVICTQDYKLNPRWFIPESMRPAHYKYHKAATYDIDEEDDEGEDESEVDSDEVDLEDSHCSKKRKANNKEESTDDIEAQQLVEKKKKSKNRKQCSICLEHINWKKEYQHIMITPCNHFFHESCLTQWMQRRLNCPTCRSQLPPLY